MSFVLMTKSGKYLYQHYTNNHGPRRLTISETECLNNATVFPRLPASREFSREDKNLIENSVRVFAKRISYVEILTEEETQ